MKLVTDKDRSHRVATTDDASSGTADETSHSSDTLWKQLLCYDSRRLFEADRIDIQVVGIFSSNESQDHVADTRIINSTKDLEVQLALSTSRDDRWGSEFFLITQLFSWGRLQITQEAFQQILTSQHVFRPFSKILHEFGAKTRDGLPKSEGIFIQCLEVDKSWEAGVEHGNCIYEENGRGHGNPWSMRQTGVYQRLDMRGFKSCWLIIESSPGHRERLRGLLERELCGSGTGYDSFIIHALMLHATVDNWARYIDYLHFQWTQFDNKVCFAQRELLSTKNHSIEILDLQNMQLLKHKLVTTAQILKSCFKIANNLESHGNNLCQMNLSVRGQKAIPLITAYASEIRCHRDNIAITSEKLQGTLDLLCKLIEYSKIESLRTISADTKSSLVSLRDITVQINDKNDAAASLLLQGHKDAKAVKALATISTILLPASLIATIFSSSLVQLRANETSSQSPGTHLIISSQFWIFVLASLTFTVITMGCTRFLEHHWLNDLLSFEKLTGRRDP
ncbi:hypothetical protein NA56DRAFT_709698 [Hyaloscypha hepaticicola]|uniref:CorA-like transporter domain-containing protein n=1 Tax=Hyaloscypha hepaticicola TaxID=2082293 RepID=A0A2J6PNI5_9HELO|nr:hypothetical protein NA56DRAFT_709698 [Hyaloscypha hepaticicola]